MQRITCLFITETKLFLKSHIADTDNSGLGNIDLQLGETITVSSFCHDQIKLNNDRGASESHKDLVVRH